MEAVRRQGATVTERARNYSHHVPKTPKQEQECVTGPQRLPPCPGTTVCSVSIGAGFSAGRDAQRCTSGLAFGALIKARLKL